MYSVGSTRDEVPCYGKNISATHLKDCTGLPIESSCMTFRSLGRTKINVSQVAFGAGPVSGLMTEADLGRQRAVVQRAIECGINWFDTAATYGAGQSESALGNALRSLGAADEVHIATKVRLLPEHLADIAGHVRTSIHESLRRLGVERVTLLQLHNAVTVARDDEPTSLTPDDVLGSGGVLDALKELQASGEVRFLGLTGIGQPEALRQVINSGAFDTIQTPYHVLNPSSGHLMPSSFAETNYGDIVSDCVRQQMGVFAIRVYAAGALAGNPPSEHTFRTKFFPLDLYNNDVARSARLCDVLGCQRDELIDIALRYALSHADISAAIVGMGEPPHVDQAVNAMEAGPLSSETIDRIHHALHPASRTSQDESP